MQPLSYKNLRKRAKWCKQEYDMVESYIVAPLEDVYKTEKSCLNKPLLFF